MCTLMIALCFGLLTSSVLSRILPTVEIVVFMYMVGGFFQLYTFQSQQECEYIPNKSMWLKESGKFSVLYE